MKLPKLNVKKETISTLNAGHVQGGGTNATCIMPTDCQPCISARCESHGTNCAGCGIG